MAETNKVLGQAYPAAGVLTAVYTVPGATSAICSTIVACNQSDVATDVRVSVAIAGAADTPAQYIGYLRNGLQLGGGDSAEFTFGLTLATTDVIRVYSGNGAVSFNVFGVELT
jgi:hypothetical protein